MRNNPTEWEKRLWRHLSNSQLSGYKFRRQSVIGPFVCDFLCPAKALIIEIDGDTHDMESDARRDTTLSELGYRTLRFTNAEVRNNMTGVLEHILATANATPDRWPGRPHPNPSPNGEGLDIATS
ncbi:DNA methylase [Stakelama pacifica]|nr:DNA methylase [Stakelama pacifica]